MKTTKRDNWTLEDSLYDFIFKAVQEQSKVYFNKNTETFERVFKEFLSPERIKECLEDYDFERWLYEQIQELATPIIEKRLEEIRKAVS